MNDCRLGSDKHYKGKMYEVIGCARHSEILEEPVVYRAKYKSEEFGEDALWIRPKAMFFERVTIEGEEMPRFKHIG